MNQWINQWINEWEKWKLTWKIDLSNVSSQRCSKFLLKRKSHINVMLYVRFCLVPLLNASIQSMKCCLKWEKWFVYCIVLFSNSRTFSIWRRRGQSLVFGYLTNHIMWGFVLKDWIRMKERERENEKVNENINGNIWIEWDV
jgi:hypothetical protein